MPVTVNDKALRNRLILATYEAGFGLHEVSGLFGVSRQRVQQILPRTAARKPGKPHSLLPADKSYYRDLRRMVQEVAAILDDWSITRICSSLGVLPHRARYGGRLARKLVQIYINVDVQVVALWNAGLSAKDICDLTGTSENSISVAITKARRRGEKCRYRRLGWNAKKGVQS